MGRAAHRGFPRETSARSRRCTISQLKEQSPTAGDHLGYQVNCISDKNCVHQRSSVNAASFVERCVPSLRRESLGTHVWRPRVDIFHPLRSSRDPSANVYLGYQLSSVDEQSSSTYDEQGRFGWRVIMCFIKLLLYLLRCWQYGHLCWGGSPHSTITWRLSDLLTL